MAATAAIVGGALAAGGSIGGAAISSKGNKAAKSGPTAQQKALQQLVSRYLLSRLESGLGSRSLVDLRRGGPIQQTPIPIMQSQEARALGLLPPGSGVFLGYGVPGPGGGPSVRAPLWNAPIGFWRDVQAYQSAGLPQAERRAAGARLQDYIRQLGGTELRIKGGAYTDSIYTPELAQKTR